MNPGMNLKNNLIFDADDTLWENNVYYEEIRSKFLALTDQLGVAREDVEFQIDETEQKNIRLYGYGSENFIRSLKQVYALFAHGGDHLQETLDLVESYAKVLYDFHIELLPQVKETLQSLHPRHRFFLLTKGDVHEQTSKVRKSGLEPLFEGVVVVQEKDVTTYEGVVQRFSLDKSVTWMIGNSPRSDINPALAAGLGAVFIPHDLTWHFEKIPLVQDHPRLVVVESFGDLTKHF
jgi:putative hydrolase of the HAD superfamily